MPSLGKSWLFLSQNCTEIWVEMDPENQRHPKLPGVECQLNEHLAYAPAVGRKERDIVAVAMRTLNGKSLNP